MTTEERGQEEQERRQKKRIKRILLPLLALWLAVQLGKCIYREERRRLGYAHAVEQYMNRKYRKFGDRFRFYFENEERPNGVSTVKFYSEKFPDGADYCYYPIERDYWWDENGAHYLDNYMCLWYQKKMWEAYVPFFDEAFGKGQYTISGGAILMPDWQDYGPETGLEEYLNTAESFSIALDVKGDFTKSEEAIEILRKRMVERNWGLQLYISYVDQDGNEIAYDRVGINTYSIERVKLD
ncbi:hypothetical protein HMPREF9623_01392 [Stomatobaculum longum]|uniref:Uncharacterized protein n=1 Tax=Stomatobaculum longum TaxID=796942 RepID=A0AA37DGC0_9FIRM|nr:hypothetical protein [Stomatobaculum longum]EHO16693.1 hypothetical protein HMPREF9623_01392 [Stomatobaculum longum]